MRKTLKYTLFGLLVIICIFIIIFIISCSLNPLRKSTDEIRNDILKLTPVGTSMDDVIKTVENNEEWKISWKSDEHGYADKKGYGYKPNKEDMVGVKSMNVYMGAYSNIFVTHVEAFYGFDENSKLVDVWIRKTTDGL